MLGKKFTAGLIAISIVVGFLATFITNMLYPAYTHPPKLLPLKDLVKIYLPFFSLVTLITFAIMFSVALLKKSE